MKKPAAPKVNREDATFLVGYCGEFWSGGAFPSDAKTPEEAAAELYAYARSGFPKADKIKAARLTGTKPLAQYHLDLVGEDPTKAKSWKLDPARSHVP